MRRSIAHAVGETPFVVVPREDADERLNRLQPRSTFLKLPHGPDQGARGNLRPHPHLVRQRMGLLQPHERYGSTLRHTDRLGFTSKTKRHSRERGNPDFQPMRWLKVWIPTVVGMTAFNFLTVSLRVSKTPP